MYIEFVSNRGPHKRIEIKIFIILKNFIKKNYQVDLAHSLVLDV